MTRFLVGRVAAIIPMLLVVSLVVFGVLQFIPGDPARIYAGEDARVTEEYLQNVRQQLGLDQPIHIQYLRWLGRTLTGDFGTSSQTKREVSRLILDALPVTFYLSITTITLAVLIGVPAGLVSALKRDTPLDLVITIFATFGVAMPSFWLAIVLILLLSVQLGWLPAFGYVNPLVDPLASLKLVILPSLTLGLSMCAAIMRQLRSSMLNVLKAEYITTARAKGLPGSLVLFRHALKNAMIPVVTTIGVQATVLMSGTVITESIFAIPGLGRLAVQAITAKDYPVLMASMLVITLVVLVINLAVDLSYGFLDPRIRYS